ncbi:MAG: MBL fold metallo-hydrolase [Alphaproteobacteria bacterium]|nr:MBL fold metallo-hydrolase [Alphaproteobacteria bacterium]MCB9696535.1 MBL fold metallo-hydrolase [Alphaproteobacteria bacterium]
MRFTVLGSGTSVPDADRGPAGFLVECGGVRWLADAGSGTVGRCARAGVDPRTLDGIVFSHHHPDHCADLVPLLFSMRVGPPPRTRDLAIVAGEGFGTFFSGLQGVYGKWIQPGRGHAILTELTRAGPAEHDLGGGLTLRTRPANHAAAALHLRFEALGVSVTFSGDTGPSEALVELARGTDLLVCECAGTDDAPVSGHLSPSDVADLARRAEPGAIWLTHLYPNVDPGLALRTVAAAGRPVRRAADLDRFDPLRARSPWGRA